jgi:signal transduction histidine kinase/CheY-like chemotaxis protein
LRGQSRRVYALTARRGGELWAARRDGLSWRGADGVWTHLGPRRGALGSLPARALWNIQFDSHGGLWVATLGGGFAYLSALAWTAQAWVPAPGEPGALPEARVRGLTPDGDSLWIGTQEAGLLHLDRRSGLISPVPATRIGGVQRVRGMARRPEGLWVARDGGVSLLRDDQPDLQWPLNMDGGPGDGMPDEVLDGGDGSMLVSVLGRGLYRLAPGWGYRTVTADLHAPLSSEQLYAGPDAPWVASERGLHRYDGDCQCLRWWPELPERVHALALDANGRWWLALDDRLQWREAGSAPGHVLREVAWPEAPAGGIAADSFGRLWIAGPSGLAVLEPGAERVRHLAGSLGPIAAELSDKPFSVDDQGRLWFGSDRGVLRIDPALLPAAPKPRRLSWEEISIRRDGQRIELDPGDSGRLRATDSDLQVAARVAMPLEAGALHYRSRIDGWDPDWVDMVQGRRAIGVLPAGAYLLQLQVWHPASPDSLLSQQWRFEVAPPWWRQWPFLLLWLTLAAIALWQIQRWQKRRIEAAHQLQMHRQQAQWAEQSAAETNAFLARLSHEIRNPLSGLLGLLRQAEADTPRAEQRERLGLVRSAALQISALVDDVLVWARGTHGQLVTRCEDIVLGPLMAEALARQQPQADARKLTLVTTGDPGLAVRADRSRLLQILDNLLGNALKFTERGRIELGWRALDAERVQLWVQDDGPGIPASDREAVFQAHRQLDTDGRGLGLGLAIARDLAQAMGGRLILLDPPLGLSGARFALELSRVVAPRTPATIEPAVARAGTAEARSSRRWVLVEDDPLQRASLAHELAEGGFEVEVVGEALSALALLRGDAALGLITDLGLPEVDGLTLIRMTRALTGEAAERRPIIVLTARVLPADRAAAFEAGADAVLHKPIEPTELYAQLRGAERSSNVAMEEP